MQANVVQAALKRLQVDYVDLVFCHRPDVFTPIEETVRAMNFVIDQGWAFYWGTSEWTAQQITEVGCWHTLVCETTLPLLQLQLACCMPRQRCSPFAHTCNLCVPCIVILQLSNLKAITISANEWLFSSIVCIAAS